MINLKKFIVKNNLGIIVCNKRFKDLTTMKVGGKIKTLFYPSTVDNLQRVLALLNFKKIKYFVLGNGSNIIASDKTFYPLVISGKLLSFETIFYDEYFECSAFMDLRFLNAKLVEKKITTFVNLSGIPATVGGALKMNAGAFGSSISDLLLWVNVIEDGISKKYYKSELEFGYRKSSFKENTVIIGAAFSIKIDEGAILLYQDIIKRRREKQPLNYPNSGSIFRNLSSVRAYEVIRKIDLCEYKIGGAMFSSKHSNFIVNFDNASSDDVYELINLAKKRAYLMLNVNLEEEVLIHNFKNKTKIKKT